MKKILKIKYLLLALFCLLPQFFLRQPAWSTSGTNFQIKIKAVCGNEVQEWNEDCDGEDMGSGTCITEGFNSGSLSCEDDCTYNTSECIIIIPPEETEEPVGSVAVSLIPSTPVPPARTTVVFMGYAYPHSRIMLLKDAQEAAAATAGDDGRFNISLSGISAGGYVFAVLAKDQNNVKSALVTFPLVVNSGTTNEVSGVFLPPTITIDAGQIKKGGGILISGWTMPLAEVNVAIAGVNNVPQSTQANSSGYYQINLETAVLESKQYFITTSAVFGGVISPASHRVNFFVVDQPAVEPEKKESQLFGDLSGDGQVGLVDFNIGLYWYKKPLDEIMLEKEKRLFNGDGKIDLIDFSILAYRWSP